MKEKKRIIYFTKHTEAGPSSRYRSYAYHQFLKENGFEILVCPLFPSAYLKQFYRTGKKPWLLTAFAYARRFLQLLFLKRYDILYIEYELFPYLPFSFEKWGLRKGRPFVMDYDDAIFHNYDKSKIEWIKEKCGEKIQQLVAGANLVITGSPYLTRWMLPYAKEVIEIPTSISLQTYSATPAAQLPGEEKTLFRIGWIGSPTTSPFVLQVKDCLRQLQELYHCQLVLIGFDKKLEKELAGLQYINYPWQSDTEIALLKTCDVGIMPLPNEPFAMGKCGFKLIQYMACALPTVSTPVEANIKINHGGENLFANTTFEWYSCLSAIIQNQSFYKEVGEKNKALVTEYYSVENNRMRYLSLIQNLVDK